MYVMKNKSLCYVSKLLAAEVRDHSLIRTM